LSGIDDFTFTGRGDQILAAQNGTNEASLVESDGTHQTVLTAADGSRTYVGRRPRKTVYVASGAYLPHGPEPAHREAQLELGRCSAVGASRPVLGLGGAQLGDRSPGRSRLRYSTAS